MEQQIDVSLQSINTFKNIKTEKNEGTICGQMSYIDSYHFPTTDNIHVGNTHSVTALESA